MSETQQRIRPEQTETTVPEARMPSVAPPMQEEAEDEYKDFWDGIDELLKDSQDLAKHYRQKGGQ